MRTDRQPRDSAECNLLSSIAARRARRHAICDQNSLLAKRRRCFAREIVSNRRSRCLLTRHVGTIAGRVNDQASAKEVLCAIAHFADTDLLNRELLWRAADQLVDFGFARDREQSERERVHRPQPKAGLHDAGGGGTRCALSNLIELGELDPPKL